MKISLIPREEQFFDLLEGTVQYLVDGAVVLDDLARDYTQVESKVEKLNGIERACDEICHGTLEKLETTFITPFDREDIHEMVNRLDDVIDMITSAASRLVLFRISAPRPPVAEFTRVILQQTRSLQSAVSKLRNPKQYSLIRNDCIEVHRLENEADEVMKQAIGALFEQETNAIELVRWKEIYQTLETITDCGEDAANVIQGIVVKNA